MDERKGFLLPEQIKKLEQILKLKGILGVVDGPILKLIDDLLLEKLKAKIKENFAQSDALNNEIADLNSAIEDGVYSFYGSTNTPDGFSGYGQVYVSARAAGGLSQIFITRVAGETGKAYFRYCYSNVWHAWKCISVEGHTHVGTAITSAVANATNATTAGSCSGNAATATKLATARTISLTGDVTGSASFNGSANASITATVADDSHNHTIANVDSLQTSLNAKLALAGGTMTGVLYPQQNTSYTTGQARRIILSTGNPSGGGNGDVWIKYIA